MKLEHKRALVARTLEVGKNRIIFNKERLAEIREAITKQDIRDLVQDKAITIAPIKGRRTVQPRKWRRRHGKVRKKVRATKKEYVSITRKLRAYSAELRSQGKITKEHHTLLRKEIRAHTFKNKAQIKDRITNLS